MKRIFVLMLVATLLLTGCDKFNPAVSAGIDDNGNTGLFKIDPLTRAITTISSEHAELHEGDMFSYCNVTDLANSANISILFYTPLTGNFIVHMVPEVTTESEAEYRLYESPTVSANGTAQTPVNRNRTSANTASSLVFYQPTVTSYGTLLCQKHWGSGKGVGGGDRAEEEWVLKPNTKYIFEVINFTTSANHETIDLTWYKQTEP